MTRDELKDLGFKHAGLDDPLVSEALADEVDFFWYDLEHCPMGQDSLNAHLLAARSRNIPSIVRVADNGVGFIKPILDSGANGIIVPQVKDAEEVRNVVKECRYKPIGERGIGPRVPSNFGRKDLKELMSEANENIFVAVMIENTEAVDDIDR